MNLIKIEIKFGCENVYNVMKICCEMCNVCVRASCHIEARGPFEFEAWIALH